MHSVRDLEANAARYAALSPDEKAKADRELFDHRRSLIVDEIAAERLRQIEREGWTPEHDDQHKAQDMALAAACYAAGSTFERPLSPEERREERTHAKRSKGIWPWDKRWWKPTTRRRDLIKAAALILAEIERMDRAGAAQ